MNGSPLFTGDAGGGESEIRRWIIENDWLEAIIALPEQLFYNTGIATYVWILTNRKSERRAGKIQLIDASTFWGPRRKSLGDKRRDVTPDHAGRIVQMYLDFHGAPEKYCKILANQDLGYRKIRVERPERWNFGATPERIARLREERAFQNLATSRKVDDEARAAAETEGRQKQEAIVAALEGMAEEVYLDCREFDAALEAALERAGIDLDTPVRSAIRRALAERDEEAEICCDGHGRPCPDKDLRDYERVPLDQTAEEYFAREVKPHLPDAWLDKKYVDERDRQPGKVGYEINFNRYFYEYQPPRPLEEIEADIRASQEKIAMLLQEVTA
jgi:type I restriction enzyme M protein